MGGRKAISINILKTVAMAAAVGPLVGGVYNRAKYGNYDRIPEGLVNDFKANWKTIIGMPVLAGLVSMALGRYSPRVGIPKALSVKAF